MIHAIEDGCGDDGVFNLLAHSKANIGTTKGAAGYGIINLIAGQWASCTAAAVVADGNLLTVRSYTSCSAQGARFIIDEDGDVFYAGGTNACHWDEYCDVAMLTGLRAITMPEGSYFKERFSGFIDKYACVLEETGVVHLNRTGDSIPFISTKGLNGLIMDSIRQLGDRTKQLELETQQLRKGLSEGGNGNHI